MVTTLYSIYVGIQNKNICILNSSNLLPSTACIEMRRLIGVLEELCCKIDIVENIYTIF